MRESDVRRRIVEALAELDAQAVENGCHPGTPDIEYIGGWIEVKYVPKWPVRADTPLRIPHFTAVQRAWLKRRAEKGGPTWVIVRVDKDWMLFQGAPSSEFLGILTKHEMIAHAYHHQHGNLDNAKLLQAIKDW